MVSPHLLCLCTTFAQCQDWMQFGSGMQWQGTIGPVGVRAIENFNGEMYAGGGFYSAGGVNVNRIARWNGSQWQSVGDGITSNLVSNHSVTSFKVHDEKLYIGGSWFTHAGGIPSSAVALWNGTNYESLAGGVGPAPAKVLTLEVYNGDLYAGGTFTSAGGLVCNRIARWDGAQWNNLGSGINGSFPQVNCMAVWNGSLYVGGEFSLAGGVPCNNVARWDGQAWSNCGNLQSTVTALEVYNNTLYASGPGILSTIELAYLSGSTWFAVPQSDFAGATINAMRTINGRLYVVGNFTTINGQLANRVTSWNGQSWYVYGPNEIGADASVHAIAPTADGPDDSFIIGGDFIFAGGEQSNYIAQWNCAPCSADFNSDWVVDVSDLLAVISGWGQYDVSDLLNVLNNWGACP